MGGFDTQVKTAQAVFSESFRHLMRICFKMDETLWPDVTKEVRGVNAGAPYEITYSPSKDINGDYWCDVTYGMMAGLDPNRALVFGLQARGDKLISRDYLRRQMPWEMNITFEEQRIEVEELREALLQATASYAQALPTLAAQGQDPTRVINALAQAIKDRQGGAEIEEAVANAFASQVSPAVAAPGEAQAPGQMAPAGGPMAPAPQQGGGSSLQNLLAGLSSSGQANLSANVARRQPA
jgi:hypothetical protein